MPVFSPSSNRIFFFGHDTDKDPPAKEILGGKGFSLASMSKAGLNVPPGFIIPTYCCANYYESKETISADLLAEIKTALGRLENAADRKLGVGPNPLLVSVRSGAAASMPGMMDTVLNVGLHGGLEKFYPDAEVFWSAYGDFIKLYSETVYGINLDVADKASGPGTGSRQAAEADMAAFKKAAGADFPTDPWEMLVQSIAAVFKSWNSERAIHYRNRNNIRGLSGTAVTVQMMFPSEQSGVLFTQDPTCFESGRIVIEAAAGLGEAIVRGRVEPDVYLVKRDSLEIVEKRISSKDFEVHSLGGDSVKTRSGVDEASLTDDQIISLAKLGLKVEEYFKHPVDIEWGLVNGRFALLQSRPIRGVEIAEDVEPAKRDEIAALRERMKGRNKVVWAVHNLAETLPSPLPLTWDIIGSFMSGKGGFGRLYEDLGFVPSARVKNEGFLDLIAGRIYVDLDKAAELFYADYPLEYDFSANNEAVDPLTTSPTKFNIERAGGIFLLKLPWYIYLMIRSSRVLRRTAANYLTEFENRILPSFLDYCVMAKSKNLSEMSDEEVLKELDEREKVLNEFGKESLKPSFLAGYYHAQLVGDLEMVFGKQEGQTLASSLLKGLPGDKTVEANIALFNVSRNSSTMDEFLREFGHRSVGEFELSQPRWSEDPSYPQKMVDNYRRIEGVSPKEIHERQVGERLAAESGLSEALQSRGAASLEADIRNSLKGARSYMPYRETGKHYFMKSTALVRETLDQLAQRWNLGRDLYYLHRHELAQFLEKREEMEKIVAKRKIRWQALQRLNVPEIISSENPDVIGKPSEAAAKAKDGVFSGTAIAPGVNVGIARVVKNPNEVGDLGPRYIIICMSTDPGWTPLFVHARGLVVERGGMLSHGAIVARDFGIPGVVIRDATKLIADGAEIKIDGNRGTVELVASAAKEVKQ